MFQEEPKIIPKTVNWTQLIFVVLFIYMILNALFILRLNKMSKNDVMGDYLKNEKINLLKEIKEQTTIIDELSIRVTKSEERVKHLQESKKTIEYVYINKTKEIENLYVNGLLDEYKHLLPKSNN